MQTDGYRPKLDTIKDNSYHSHPGDGREESNMVLTRENINGVGKTIMTPRAQKTNTGMVRSLGKLVTLGGWVVEHMRELMGSGTKDSGSQRK